MKNLQERINKRIEEREDLKKQIDDIIEQAKPLRKSLRKVTNLLANDQFRMRAIQNEKKSK